MTVFIPEWLCGVVGTLLVELTLIIGYSIWRNRHEKK